MRPGLSGCTDAPELKPPGHRIFSKMPNSYKDMLMKFSILLYGFDILLRFTSWKYESFRNLVRDFDFSMVIRTADGKKARRYSSAGGKISSNKGNSPAPDFSLVWKDAGSGYRSMMKMKPGALMKAVQDGSLKLEGDAGKLTRFLATFKAMLECYR